MSYTLETTVIGDFEEVLNETVAALEDEGFGILSDIDTGGTIREALGEEFRNYRILGACNPSLAREALDAEIEVGTLLPCNVAVFDAEDTGVTVAAVEPHELLAIGESSALHPIADDITGRVERTIATVETEFDTVET